MLELRSERYCLTVFSAVVCIQAVSGWSVQDWYPHIARGPSFSGSSFHSADMGSWNMTGRVVAFGDFNSDSYTDVFVLSRNRVTGIDVLSVYTWDYWSYAFIPIESLAIHEANVLNVIPADFDMDGRLDVLLQGGGSDLEEPFLKVWFGDGQTLANPASLPLASILSIYGTQAIVVDANGDMAIDVYVQRHYWMNEGDGRNWRLETQLEDEDENGDGAEFRTVVKKHSNAVVDLTGDCFADLILFTTATSEAGQPIGSDDEEDTTASSDAYHSSQVNASSDAEGSSVEDGTSVTPEDSDWSSSVKEDISDMTVSTEYESDGVVSTKYLSQVEDDVDVSLSLEDETESEKEEDEWGSSQVEVGVTDSVYLYSISDDGDDYETPLTDEEKEDVNQMESDRIRQDKAERGDDGEMSLGVENALFDTADARIMELWQFKHHTFQLKSSYSLPEGTGRTTFADVDADGALDVIFTECYPSDCSKHNRIHIVFNKQLSVCSGLVSTDDCLADSDLCGGSSWKIPDLTADKSGKDVVIVPSDVFDGWSFVWAEKGVYGPLTAPRVGDYNLDGYPDLMLLVEKDRVRLVQLWVNVECSENLCGDKATAAGRRTFVKVTEGVDDLEEVVDAVDVGFFDIDEDGALDIIVNTRDDDDTGEERVRIVYNGLGRESMFLKVMGSNGVCPQWCPTTDGAEKFPDPKPVGVNYPGATFKFSMTDGSGKKRVGMAGQLSQTASGMQLPYALFGLGRTSSYVDYLYMGVVADTGKDAWFNWQGVIPNAQVAIFPYPADSPSSWFMLMYIHPSGIFFWVVMACALCCLVLAALYFLLHKREQMQDKEEAKNRAHLFNL